MSDLNDPLKDSYIGKVADALTPYTDDLKAKGFDPASRIEQLTGAGVLIESAVKLRKQAEKAASDAVGNEQALRGQFYTLATSTVSLVKGCSARRTPSPANSAACAPISSVAKTLARRCRRHPRPFRRLRSAWSRGG